MIMAFCFQRHVLIILTFSLILIACSVAEDGLTTRRVVINTDHKYVYKIQVPQDDTGVLKTFAGHGHSFGVGYRDSSFIYYIDDSHLATLNYSGNDTLVGFTTPIGGLQTDTVIGEQQVNGRYWKEVFHNGYYIGYKNVPKERLEAFDKSLRTFRRKR
jgi:hypothetical protein